ncbi:hypothetical protein B9479_006742 [Cryptococcus floricola]|uniref:Uncharacterized protein n=1 Tax=Cryptococcus floricola TaxID=2591691 RepID=A0A5D3ARE8_9TREE|nr:hypothetical protein B9479_006742 [Cryptococcus floricola]
MSISYLDYEQPPLEGEKTWDEEQEILPKQRSYTTPAPSQTADTTTASSDTHSTSKYVADVDDSRDASSDTHSTSKYVADVDDSQEAGANHDLEEGEIADEDSKATSAGAPKNGRATEESSSRAGSIHRQSRHTSSYASSE